MVQHSATKYDVSKTRHKVIVLRVGCHREASVAKQSLPCFTVEDCQQIRTDIQRNQLELWIILKQWNHRIPESAAKVDSYSSWLDATGCKLILQMTKY